MSWTIGCKVKVPSGSIGRIEQVVSDGQVKVLVSFGQFTLWYDAAEVQVVEARCRHCSSDSIATGVCGTCGYH